jgi:hypothetical protein
MSFCRFFGVGEEVHPSRLAESDFMKMVAGRTQTSGPGEEVAATVAKQ